MIRYITLRKPPRQWTSDSEVSWLERPSIQVFEPDGTPQETGLVDVTGAALYRVEDRTPIGFRGRKE